jgi:hypothetical protein
MKFTTIKNQKLLVFVDETDSRYKVEIFVILKKHENFFK